MEEKRRLDYDGDIAQRTCRERNEAASIPEIAVIRLYDECVEKAWHRDYKNGDKYEKHAGGDVHAVHGLLQIRIPSNEHGKTRHENEVKHYAPHQTIFDNDLAVSVKFVIGIVFEQAWVAAVFV